MEAYNKEEFRRSQHRDPRLPHLPVRSYLDRVMAISKIEHEVSVLRYFKRPTERGPLPAYLPTDLPIYLLTDLPSSAAGQ